jgi:protein-S-isoprenylcysteine O-methyltransferase Ste14
MSHTGFWWILLIGAVFGFVHSLLASNKVKRLAAGKLGGQVARFYRFLYVVQSGILTSFYVVSVITFPDARIYAILFPWFLLTGAVQLIVGVCLVISLFQTGGMSFLGLEPFFGHDTQVRALKTDGFYRFTRHPIYLFSLILLWLFPYMTWNLLAFAIGITIYTLIGSLLEERRLVKEFGQAYLAYKRKTAWIFPLPFK